jgi:hypothetical protein
LPCSLPSICLFSGYLRDIIGVRLSEGSQFRTILDGMRETMWMAIALSTAAANGLDFVFV